MSTKMASWYSSLIVREYYVYCEGTVLLEGPTDNQHLTLQVY